MGCYCPLNFLYLINLKFWVRAPNGCCVLWCTSLVPLCAKKQVPPKEPKCFSCFGRHFCNVLTPIHVIRNCYTMVFCWLNAFQNLVVMFSHSNSDILSTMMNFICVAASHSPKLVRSSCRVKQSQSECMFIYRTQSAANRRTENLMLSGKSFIKIGTG